MSLINDALKRAGTVRALPAEHQGGAPMQPVHDDAAPRNMGNPMTYGMIGLAALVLITITGLLLKSKTAHMEQTEPAMAMAAQEAAAAHAALYPVPIPLEAPAGTPVQPVQVTTEPVTLPIAATEAPQSTEAPARRTQPPLQAASFASASTLPSPAPAVETTEAKIAPAAEAPNTATEPAVAVPASKPAPEPVVAAAPATFPDLQLQAIHYRFRNPTVMLNGKTVGVGQTIEGAKVTAIHRYGVEITWRSEKKFLSLD